MVRLEEMEDEHFMEEHKGTKHDELLADDDDDFTDTDSEISDASDLALDSEESIYDRIAALKDIVPPKTRAKLSSVISTVSSTTGSGITYGGKGLWVIATSVLLLGLPYALALGDEQMIQEEERQRSLMQEGAQGMMSGGEAETKPAL